MSITSLLGRKVVLPHLRHGEPLISALLAVPCVRPAHAVAPLVPDGLAAGVLLQVNSADPSGQVQRHAAINTISGHRHISVTRNFRESDSVLYHCGSDEVGADNSFAVQGLLDMAI